MAATPEMKQIIAGFERDPFQVVFQGLLRSQDETLATRGGARGLKIYDEIERDCHAYAVLQKRKYAVISFPWEVEPASTRLQDRKAAETVKAAFEGMDFDGLCVGLLDAVLKGFAVGEVLWDPATWLPAKVLLRDQRRFNMGADSRPRLITRENMQPGEELPDRKFIVHRFGAKDGSPYGLGLGTRLFWPAWFKRQGLSFWLVFAEKFGSPTVVGKYPQGMHPDEQAKLLSTLSNIAQETALVAPLETEVDLLEAARSGSVDTYEKLVRYLDEEMSKAVLGETGTTSQTGSGGSRARDQVGNEVRLELVRADADLLSATLNDTLVTWISELHHPGATPPRLWRIVEEPADLKTAAERDQILVNMGFEPSEEYIRETYGEGWTRKPPPKVQPPAFPGAAPNQAQNTDPHQPQSPAFGESEVRDLADDYTDRAEAQGAAAFAQMLEPVRRLVKQARNLEEIRDGLLDLYPEMDTQSFAELLTQAMTASHLAGRWTVRQEATNPAFAERPITLNLTVAAPKGGAVSKRLEPIRDAEGRITEYRLTETQE